MNSTADCVQAQAPVQALAWPRFKAAASFAEPHLRWLHGVGAFNNFADHMHKQVGDVDQDYLTESANVSKYMHVQFRILMSATICAENEKPLSS